MGPKSLRARYDYRTRRRFLAETQREFPMKTYSLLAAVAAIAGASAPAAAQNAYPYAQPQAYPQAGYGYGQQGYSQYPTTQNPIAQVINSLLGNRTQSPDDRTAAS